MEEIKNEIKSSKFTQPQIVLPPSLPMISAATLRRQKSSFILPQGRHACKDGTSMEDYLTRFLITRRGIACELISKIGLLRFSKLLGRSIFASSLCENLMACVVRFDGCNLDPFVYCDCIANVSFSPRNSRGPTTANKDPCIAHELHFKLAIVPANNNNLRLLCFP